MEHLTKGKALAGSWEMASLLPFRTPVLLPAIHSKEEETVSLGARHIGGNGRERSEAAPVVLEAVFKHLGGYLIASILPGELSSRYRQTVILPALESADDSTVCSIVLFLL